MSLAVDQFTVSAGWLENDRRMDPELGSLLLDARSDGGVTAPGSDQQQRIRHRILDIISNPTDHSELHTLGAVWNGLAVAPELRGDIIASGLGHPNPRIQEVSGWQVLFAKEDQRQEIIYKALQVGRRAALAAYTAVPLLLAADETKKSITEEVIAKFGLDPRNLEPCVLDHGIPDSSEAPRINKHTSDGLVRRRITPVALSVWRHVLNGIDWSSSEMPEPPAEPVLGVETLGGETDLLVTSRTMRGQSLHDSLPFFDRRVQAETMERYHTILGRISKEGVVHGHPHPKNVVLVPVRADSGEPVLTEPPAMFIVDFDKARYMEGV